MRLLTVNYALANPDIDNHSIFNAPPLFDYPAVVVDPAGVSRAIEEVLAGAKPTTPAGLQVSDDLSSPTTISLAEILRRRREETIRLLQRGGGLIGFAYPNVPHPRVTGFTGCDRYFWLPAPAGQAYREGFLNGADGGPVSVVDQLHALATTLNNHETSVRYRAYFKEEVQGFYEFARVIARSPGGAAAADEFPVLGGRVVVEPPIDKLAPTQAP